MAICREREQEPSSLFTASKVRGVAQCLACDKLRCLYCDKQSIYKENENIVILAIESNSYICGSPIFPENHSLSELIRVCHSVSCKSPIERSYYSNKTLKLPSLCVCCGEKDCSIPESFQQRFKQVLPICAGCSDKKLEPITYKKDTLTFHPLSQFVSTCLHFHILVCFHNDHKLLPFKILL